MFERYERPETCQEAVSMLTHYGDRAALLAGGTDLIPRLRKGTRKAETVIDLTRISSLQGIGVDGEQTYIASGTKLREIVTSQMLSGTTAVLRHAASQVSSMQVRNLATLGGNLCNASPSADTVPALLILDAKVLIEGPKGERTEALDSFLLPEGGTSLKKDELVKGLILPSPEERSGSAYHKYAIRGSHDISIVGAGALLALDEQGKIQRCRIALASVGPRTLRMHEAEQFLVGKEAGSEVFREASRLCGEFCKPISDQRASADYRKNMVELWTLTALQDAVRRC